MIKVLKSRHYILGLEPCNILTYEYDITIILYVLQPEESGEILASYADEILMMGTV